MSSIGRAAPRGSKSGKVDNSVSNKSQKSDTKTETLKTDNSKAQPTAEQMRIAQIIDAKIDDPSLKEKIQQVIDATHKSELEACAALHDCDNDLDRAVNLLLEGQAQGWETSVKKKKNRQPSVNSKAESSPKAVAGDTEENWDDDTPPKPPTDGPQPRSRPRGSGGPPRMRGRGSLDNRGWRGRENKENERNLEGGSAVGPGGDRDRDRDRERDGFRRGGGGGRGGRMSNGPSRGGGRGGSRMGPRTFQSRGGDRNSGGSSGGFPRSIETWNNPDHETTTTENKAATFAEDWDNEEYTGSLADTKVFTPSTAGMPDGPSAGPASSAQASSNVGAGEASLDAVNTNTNSGLDLHSAQTNSLLSQSPVTAGGLALNPAQSQYLSQLTRDSQLSSQLSNQISSQLSNQLSSSADDQKMASLSLAGSSAATSVSNAPASYANSYSASTYAASAAQSSMYSAAAAAAAAAAAGVTNDGVYAGYQAPQSQSANYSNAYSGQDRGVTQPTTASQPLPARTKTQRAKMPAPSKIPSSAVEMPGDAVNSGISFLDVQFGGLDLCSETFDASSTASEPQASPQPSQNQTKFSGGSAGADSSASSAAQASLDVSAQSCLDSYSKSSLSQSLTMNNAGFILQQSQQQQQQQQGSGAQQQSPSQSQQQSSDIKGSQSSAYAQQSRGPSGVGVGSSLDGLVKNDGISSSSAGSGNTSATHAYSGSSSSYQSNYQSQKNSSSGYQPSVSYNASTYSQSQVTSAATGYSSNQAPSSYTNSSYSSSTAPSNAYPSNSYGNAQSSGAGYSTSSGAAPSSASAATTYPSMSQPAGYPASAASQAYQSGVYGNSSASNAGTASVLGSTSGYTTSSSTPYQNSYSAPTASNKVSSALSSGTKDQQFDATATASSTLSNSVSGAVSASPALGITAVNNATSTKVSTSAAKSSVVANMPPGMQPIMTGTPQYIINQGGLPYFQQPAVYSYDEQQLLQLRIQPHMTTGYYDIPFPQAPTSLAAGREGSIASVQYSMSDGRFARTDNASPVPSSVSQQQNATQPHQQPIMNAASFPQGYAYYYSSLPANYQYGTPMYPPVAPATNAHGNSNTTQYTKQGNYGSGYGLGYEGLSGSQDYSKPGGYVSGSQTGSKTGVGANAPSTGASGSDLYTKGHVALSKVNSYEKQGFHSGTPPPFNLASSQSTGLPPSGAYAPHLFIPTMAPHHQQHSTTLMHQPLHQIEMRSPARRVDSGTSSGQRSQSSTQPNKAGAKQPYSPSYWTPN